ncbi:pantoate--beta-alanine ligase [Ekhidna sp.]|uniref:pantoate--beta-alanine ligase n=1 Tax=Ekhidna sp. TaxID=2608089 RepID=UPI00351528C1
MRVLSASIELSNLISALKKEGKSIGFVPTMGALHEGHFSLIQRAKDENEVVVVSIFVNPLQFNNEQDLAKYPRIIEQDLEGLKKLNIDVVFTPSEKELYPEKPVVSIDFGKMATVLEGEFRSGHFEGVGIVVSKLLHLTQPDRAYFGLKDLQQFILIRKMCTDLNFPTEIIGVGTVREDSGLALSSRNARLSDKGRKEATIIFKGLNRFRSGILKKEDFDSILKNVNEMFFSAEGFDLEYLRVVDPADLSEIKSYDTVTELAVCVAGYVEGVRLIDNLYLRLK